MGEAEPFRPSFVLRGLIWLIRRLTPREGWLSFLLLIIIAVGVANAVLETDWAEEIGRVWLNGWVAALLATVVVKRVHAPRRVWSLLIVSGLLFTSVRVGSLVPPILSWRDGSWEAEINLRIARFSDRLLSWAEAVRAGSSSTETLPFTFGVGMAIWLLIALLAWQTYRTHRPLPALTLICLGVAFVGYFSPSPPHWLLQVVTSAIGLAALMRIVMLQMAWDENGIDYPVNVISDFAVAAALFAVVFPLVGYASPRLAVPPVARAFANSQGVQAVEEVLERLFGGVEVRSGGGGGTAGQAVGVMPRQHLLSGSPELLQSVVMTATIQGDAWANHWRALSYDNYTGRGWQASAESETNLPANRPIPHPAIIAVAPMTQTIRWLQDDRATRYSLGRPEQFDQPTRLQWHGRSDLVRVRGDGRSYQVQSLVSIATAAQLEAVTLGDLPTNMMARYTPLPDTIPQRVLDLAQSVTADATTPYAKAQAIETFLRQYDYSLEVNAPPANQDVVDFFLFDQQAGYCDYYATAMTVMARAVGLPARMAIGFAAAPTIDGQQTLRGIDAHSWTEIYFGAYGWIEFEPTGGFALRDAGAFGEPSADLYQLEPLPIPTRSVAVGRIVIFVALSLAIVALIAAVVWWSLLPPPLPNTATRYLQLQQHAARLAVPISENQTPLEFLALFDRRVSALGELNWIRRRPRIALQLAKIRAVANTLTQDFIRVQYDQQSLQETISTRQWRRTRGLLWLLQKAQRLI